MEQVNAIRSFEELQYIIKQTFDNLWVADQEARNKGEWLIHITEKEDKLYIRNANLETALRISCERFAALHDDREMGLRTIKRDFKRLGIITQTNAKRTIKKESGEEKKYAVTVMNLDAIDWIMDTPLLHDDTMARMQEASKETSQNSWLRKWVDKVLEENRGD